MMARRPNITLGSGRFLALSGRKAQKSPFFVLPALFWLPKRDLSFTLMTHGVGVCWGFWSAQAEIIWTLPSPQRPPIDAARAQKLAEQIHRQLGRKVAPGAVRAAFSQPHLRAMHANGVEATPCGLRLLCSAALAIQAQHANQAGQTQAGQTAPVSSGASLQSGTRTAARADPPAQSAPTPSVFDELDAAAREARNGV